jgi:hypothetical protein
MVLTCLLAFPWLLPLFAVGILAALFLESFRDLAAAAWVSLLTPFHLTRQRSVMQEVWK